MVQMSSRDDSEKSYNVPLPDNSYVTVYLRESMTVEEFLATACVRKNLNPMEHFVRVKKRREMEDHNYFVPHRNDLIETYVSTFFACFYFNVIKKICFISHDFLLPTHFIFLSRF